MDTVYGQGGYDPQAPDGNVVERAEVALPAEIVNERLVLERLRNDFGTIRDDDAWRALTAGQKVETLRRAYLRLARAVLHAYQEAD